MLKEMLGKRMNAEQLAYLKVLQAKVKDGEVTVEEAKRRWNKKYKVWKKEA